MRTHPPTLSVKEFLSFHLFYLLPVLIRGALISRSFGTWFLQFYPDPIGRRFFSQLVKKHKCTVFQTWAASPPFGFDRTFILLDIDLVNQLLDTDESANYEVSNLNQKFIGRFAPGSLILSNSCEHAKLRDYTVSPERLATGSNISTHPQAKRILETVDAEVGVTLNSSRPYFTWLEFSSLAARLTIRILLGTKAGRDDADVSDVRLVQLLKELIYSATGVFGRRSRHYDDYYSMLKQRMRAQAGQSLIGEPDLEHASEAQVTFWMMALNGGLDTVLPRTLALILSHNDIYSALLEELEAIDLKNPEEIDNQLPLFEGCVLETIRLWTDTPLINRRRLSDGKVGQYQIPAETQVLIPAAYLHRDLSVFGNSANQFKPHRWLEVPFPDGLQFGAGARGCAGKEVALFVIKACLAHIIYHYKLKLYEPDLNSSSGMPDLFDHFRLRIKKV